MLAAGASAAVVVFAGLAAYDAGLIASGPPPEVIVVTAVRATVTPTAEPIEVLPAEAPSTDEEEPD